MGNSYVRVFAKQAGYSSESSSDRGDSDGKGATRREEEGCGSIVSNFVTINEVPPSDSGVVSAEHNSQLILGTTEEGGSERDGNLERQPVEVEGQHEDDDEHGAREEIGNQQEASRPVFPEHARPREHVEHSPNSSPPISPPPSPTGSAPPNSDSLTGDDDECSDGRVSSSPSAQIISAQQESCGLPQELELHLNRLRVIQEVVWKTSRIFRRDLKLRIPTCARRCYARLIIDFIPYRKEWTEWPDRFCYMDVRVNIPHRCTDALTVSHRCKVVVSVNVSSSPSIRNRNDLLDGGRPLTHTGLVIPGATDEVLTRELRLVRHTNLIDATCEDVHVKIVAKFELQEVKYEVMDDGEVKVTHVE